MARTLAEWQTYIYDWAQRKGWWEPQCKHENRILYDGVVEWCKDCGATYFIDGEWTLPSSAKSRNLGELHMLFITEIAESFEDIRNHHQAGDMWLDENNKPQGPAIELADLAIRILDYAGHYNINLDHYIEVKMDYNEKRPYRHGGKAS